MRRTARWLLQFGYGSALGGTDLPSSETFVNTVPVGGYFSVQLVLEYLFELFALLMFGAPQIISIYPFNFSFLVTSSLESISTVFVPANTNRRFANLDLDRCGPISLQACPVRKWNNGRAA